MENINIAQSHKIFIIGSCDLDFFYSVDHLPRTGETLQMNLMHQALGGKGFNQAINMVHSFEKEEERPEMFFVGAVGNDGSGANHIEGKKKKL